jgi:NADH-quinone oxidoreductase subunit K
MDIWAIGLEHFLVLAAALFCLGVICLLTRRTAIGILMGIELMINGANVNLVAFAHHLGNDSAGQVFALMAIVLAAIEASVALAILFALFRTLDRLISIDEAASLRG